MWHQRNGHRLWMAAVIAVAVPSGIGCGEVERPSAPLAFEHATLQFTCAPWDGPATTLYLADGEAKGGVVPPPLLMISVYESSIDAGGKRYRITPRDHNVGAALMCLTDGACEALPEAVVEFGRLDEGAPAQVAVRVTQVNGGIEDGRFTAHWIEPAGPCG